MFRRLELFFSGPSVCSAPYRSLQREVVGPKENDAHRSRREYKMFLLFSIRVFKISTLHLPGLALSSAHPSVNANKHSCRPFSHPSKSSITITIIIVVFAIGFSKSCLPWPLP